MPEPGPNRLGEHRGELPQRGVAQVSPSDVDPERQRQTRLEQPPLAEVDHLLQAFRLVGELAFVDE